MGTRELGGVGGGGCKKKRGDIGVKKTDMEIEHRRWSGEMLKSRGEERRTEKMKIIVNSFQI